MRALKVLLAGIFLFVPAPVWAVDAGSWEDLQARGTNALDANAYWIAEPTLKQAVEKADEFNPKDLRLAKSLAELGRLYTIRGRWDEAEAYLEEELSVREMVLANDRYQCIPTMGSLIQFYINHGTQSKAIPLTKEMLSLVEGRIEEARSGHYKVKYKKGQPLEAWVGVAAKSARDPIIDWAITCDAVGNAYKGIDNFDMAGRLYKAAMDIKSTVLGSEHLSLANSYDSLGSLCIEKNDYAGAESYFADALKTTERILGPDSHEAFVRMDKLARCFIKESKMDKAEEIYLRANKIWKDQTSKYGDDIQVLFALGNLYTQEHKYDQALPYLQQALERAQSFHGPDSAALVPYLKRYAYCSYYAGHKDVMEQYNSRAGAISAE